MPYPFTTGGSASVTATELVTSIFDSVNTNFYEVKYPEILWRTVFPPASILTDINPGAQNHVYRSRDKKGMGQFIQGKSANIPRVGQVIGQVTVPVLDAAVGAEVTNAEARTYSFGFEAKALSQDLGEVMRLAAEYHVERTTFFGNAAVGFEAYLDYSAATKIPTAAWSGTDPSAWVASVAAAISAVWTASKTVHLPDTVELPPGKYSLLASTPMVLGSGGGATGLVVTALEFLKKNNIYTAMTGKDLNIKPLRYLEGAGLAGVDRVIIKQMNPENFILPFPMAYQLAQPVPVPLGVQTFAEYKFGSFNMPYPKSMAYLDIAD